MKKIIQMNGRVSCSVLDVMIDQVSVDRLRAEKLGCPKNISRPTVVVPLRIGTPTPTPTFASTQALA
jgi:hypothetical protein